MSKLMEIHVAELFAGNGEYVIATSGVGSCIVVLLFDPVMRIGGMAHAILPHARDGQSKLGVSPRDPDGRRFVKYVDEAIDALLGDMITLGASKERVIAKLVGGARMFALLGGDRYGIGHMNTEIAREHLQALHISVETEVVGGTVGRNVRFDCATGVAEITTKV